MIRLPDDTGTFERAKLFWAGVRAGIELAGERLGKRRPNLPHDQPPGTGAVRPEHLLHDVAIFEAQSESLFPPPAPADMDAAAWLKVSHTVEREYESACERAFAMGPHGAGAIVSWIMGRVRWAYEEGRKAGVTATEARQRVIDTKKKEEHDAWLAKRNK